MIFYYIRHGEPIYDPDCLTPHGQLEAEALSERLVKTGLDKIYASTSNRAIQTALPTCERLGMEPELLDFANEHHTWCQMTAEKDDHSGRTWLFHHPRMIELFTDKSIRDLGDRWFEHPDLIEGRYGEGVERVYDEGDKFLQSLGYEHIRYTGKYRITEKNDRRVALFAHQGFGLLFLSCLLDIPYPQFCTHFDMCHTGVTVIDFSDNRKGKCIPKVLTLSSDSHLYSKGVESNYGLI